MQIYLDTALTSEIEIGAQSLLIDGVTTNPSLIAKQQASFEEVIKHIVKLLKPISKTFTVSAEVTDTSSVKAMVDQGKKLSKLSKYIVVKVPLTFEGLQAVKLLSVQNIRCNVTLCFSVQQALLAAKAGAYFVSPFMGRLEDNGIDSVQLLRDIKKVFMQYNFSTQILAASIRNPAHVKAASLAGADIATMPLKVFHQLYKHELTTKGIELFEKDWKKFKPKK